MSRTPLARRSCGPLAARRSKQAPWRTTWWSSAIATPGRLGGQGGNDSKMVQSSTAAICNVQDVSKRAMAGFVVDFSKGCGISLHAGCAYTNT